MKLLTAKRNSRPDREGEKTEKRKEGRFSSGLHHHIERVAGVEGVVVAKVRDIGAFEGVVERVDDVPADLVIQVGRNHLALLADVPKTHVEISISLRPIVRIFGDLFQTIKPFVAGQSHAKANERRD